MLGRQINRAALAMFLVTVVGCAPAIESSGGRQIAKPELTARVDGHTQVFGGQTAILDIWQPQPSLKGGTPPMHLHFGGQDADRNTLAFDLPQAQVWPLASSYAISAGTVEMKLNGTTYFGSAGTVRLTVNSNGTLSGTFAGKVSSNDEPVRPPFTVFQRA